MGKIERLPSGSYRIRVEVGKDEKGRRKWVSFTHPDKTRVKTLAAQFESNVKTDTGTLGGAVRAYIEAKTPVLSSSTIKAYTSYMRTLEGEYGHLMSLPLYKVKQADVQAFVNRASRDHSVKYAANLRGLISAAMTYADYDVPHSTLPHREKPALYKPTIDDIRTLMAAVEGTRLELPVALGIHGLRRSEVCALTPEDIHDDYVHVHAAVVSVPGGGTKVQPYTKTAASDRNVPITPELAAKLREGMPSFTPNALGNAFARALKSAGLPHFRFHDLRSFMVAILHEEGFSDAAIQSIGGWSTPNVMINAYRYALTSGEAQRRAADALGRVTFVSHPVSHSE